MVAIPKVDKYPPFLKVKPGESVELWFLADEPTSVYWQAFGGAIVRSSGEAARRGLCGVDAHYIYTVAVIGETGQSLRSLDVRGRLADAVAECAPGVVYAVSRTGQGARTRYSAAEVRAATAEEREQAGDAARALYPRSVPD